MSAASPVALCNRALLEVGGNTIVSFLDETTESRICALIYEPIRDAVTQAYNWAHARARAGPLALLATSPIFGWTFQYKLPVELLTLQWAGTSGGRNWRYEPQIEYEVEGRNLLCNVGEGVYIRYLKRVTDTAEFSSLFTEALVARLSAELAVPLSESRSLAQQHFQLFQAKIDEAAAVDGQQGRNMPTSAVRHQYARWTGGGQYGALPGGFYNWG